MARTLLRSLPTLGLFFVSLLGVLVMLTMPYEPGSIQGYSVYAFGPTSTSRPTPTSGPPASTYSVTNTSDSGSGSLRQAILDANAHAGRDSITFDLPRTGVHTFALASPLPTITDPVKIDATVPGQNCHKLSEMSWYFEINGQFAGLNANGLHFGAAATDSLVAGLIINRFSGVGVLLDTSFNTIQCNLIGTDSTGRNALPNGIGISIVGSGNTLFSNVVSGNLQHGIVLTNGNSNKLSGNLVGADVTGMAALGNGSNGILMVASPWTISSWNVIVANGGHGIKLVDSHDSFVYSNTIGGIFPLGNGGHGVEIDGAKDVVVSLDQIRNNAQAGIAVVGTATGVSVYGLGVDSNGQLAIDLKADGPTLNDAGDADEGPNGLQNYPILTTPLVGGPSLVVNGYLNSKPNTTYTLLFFHSATCDPSGYGEGAAFIGFTEVTTDSNSNSPFKAVLPVNVPTGRFVSAVADGPEGSSEFSPCLVVGNPPTDTVGVYRPSNANFYLRNSNTTGPADISVLFGLPTDLPIVGDWNGDNVDTIGVYRPSSSTFFLKDANTPAAPLAYRFTFGAPGDLPVAGDWNNDGRDGVGVYRPTNARLFLRNALSSGFADFAMVHGIAGDRPVAGDWNGDGTDSPGIYRPATTSFFLTNRLCNNCTITANYILTLGSSGDLALAGDWDGDGASSVGVFRPSEARFLLRNALTTGAPEVSIVFGSANDLPIAGKWVAVPAAPEQAPIFAPGR